MRIGELARISGVSTRALRYYEAQGLLTAQRRDNGYREYEQSAVARVRNIRLLVEAGLGTDSLRDINSCLDEDLKHTPACEEAVRLFEQRLEVVTRQLAMLAEMRDRLDARLRRLRAETHN